MSSPWLVPFCVLVLASPILAAGSNDSAAIADRYFADMRKKDYAFLSKDELTRRRDDIAAFSAKNLAQPLDAKAREAILAGIGRCLDRLYSIPAGTVSYSNGFGSGGEEWMYLNDRDFFLTFKVHLAFALTRQPLSPADAQRFEKQQKWMRQFLADLPDRGIHETPPRAGMRNDEVRAWALGELERDRADPLHFLSQPLPDEGFTKMQEDLQSYSNGIWDQFHRMEVAALTSRFVSKDDPAARHGRSYTGKLPFDDTVIDLWGNAPHLCFLSNADFRGNHGHLSRGSVYDVIRCLQMVTKPAPAADSPEMKAWLAKESRGELTLDGATLLAVRGAKLARLPVHDWFEADKLSDAELRASLRRAPLDRIPVKAVPPANGLHRGDRSEGEFFCVVQTAEDRLAVLNIHNFEFDQLSFWARPRPARP